MTSARRSMLTAVAALALILSMTAPVTASDGSATESPSTAALERVLDTVANGASYDALSPSDRAVLDAHLLVAGEEVRRVDLRPATLAGTGVDGTGASAALLSGCWVARVTYAGKALAGNTLYTYFVEGRWCAIGATVESAQHEWSSGETSTPGWTYHGVQGSGAGVRFNEGRAWSGHRFTLSVGGVTVQTVEPCVRVRGSATGTFTHDGVCGLG